MEWAKQYKPQRENPWQEIAETIRQTVDMGDVIRYYAPNPPPRNNRIPCPFHNGEHYNLRFTHRGYNCFVCEASGDQIAFVEAICGLPSRTEAMRRMNVDLNLNLPIDRPASNSWSAEAARRRTEAEKKRAKAAALKERREALEDEWASLDRKLHDPLTDIMDKAKARERMTYIEYELLSFPQEER